MRVERVNDREDGHRPYDDYEHLVLKTHMDLDLRRYHFITSRASHHIFIANEFTPWPNGVPLVHLVIMFHCHGFGLELLSVPWARPGLLWRFR